MLKNILSNELSHVETYINTRYIIVNYLLIYGFCTLNAETLDVRQAFFTYIRVWEPLGIIVFVETSVAAERQNFPKLYYII